MVLRNADYRVSSIVVLCKDCGEDCGLYPARHKCKKDTRPKLPTLCSSTSDSSAWSSEDEKQPTQKPDHIRVATGKWGARFRSTQINEDASVYYEKFAANLNNGNNTTGKKLWGRVKENEKWKELIANKEEKKSGKLWQRLIQATIPTLEPDYEAESDQEDWEGETHVSRVLREHHQSKNGPLPSWLLEDGDCDSYQPQSVHSIQRSTTRTRRLWQAPVEGSQETGRERERRALRENNNTLDKHSLLSRSQSERVLHDARFENDIYGSIAPRRTNTTARSNVSRIRPFQ